LVAFPREAEDRQLERHRRAGAGLEGERRLAALLRGAEAFAVELRSE
jgi:hypothetical protein